MNALPDAVAMWSGSFAVDQFQATDLPERCFDLLMRLANDWAKTNSGPYLADFADIEISVEFAGLSSTPGVITELKGFPDGVVDFWAEIVGLPHCYWIRLTCPDVPRARPLMFAGSDPQARLMTPCALARAYAYHLKPERDALALIVQHPAQEILALRRKIAA